MTFGNSNDWSLWVCCRVVRPLGFKEQLPLGRRGELSLLFLDDLESEIECLGYGEGQGVGLLGTCALEHVAVETETKTDQH